MSDRQCQSNDFFKCPPCFGEYFCNEHRFDLDEVIDSSLEPDAIRNICYGILRHAAEYCKDGGGIALPSMGGTRVSCNGEIRRIKWKLFDLAVFNNPNPGNALDATLGAVCLILITNTEHREIWLDYNPLDLQSRRVLSRKDIAQAFKNARGKNLAGMFEAIRSIRVQDIMDERVEWACLENREADEDIWSFK